jgi:cyclopropane fatty-acyl-phospholipid synthase-like methyltransferase
MGKGTLVMKNIWDERYSGKEYFYGTQANRFLTQQRNRLSQGETCLAVADGEGRNGVWLAEQGLQVYSIDASSMAQQKAQTLAKARGVSIQFEQADLLQWDWGENRFDVVVAIFIQFVGPAQREQLFNCIQRCLKSGGLLILQGYTPRQLEFKTGGPSQLENLYTAEILRLALTEMEILQLDEHDDEIQEGVGHNGLSALIDLVARKI